MQFDLNKDIFCKKTGIMDDAEFERRLNYVEEVLKKARLKGEGGDLEECIYSFLVTLTLKQASRDQEEFADMKKVKQVAEMLRIQADGIDMDTMTFMEGVTVQ